MGKDETDRLCGVEGDEQQRPRIREQPLGIAGAFVRGELQHNCFVSWREQANRDFRGARWVSGTLVHGKEDCMPGKSANVKNEKQYEKLKDKGMSKERAAKIATSPGASSRGGNKSGSSSSSKGNPRQGGTTPQKKAAGRKGGKATARKSS